MFFTRQKYTYESAKQKINDAKELLASLNQEVKITFFDLLALRIEDFESALKKENLQNYEKELIIKQYNRFANTLYACLKNPNSCSRYTQHYYNSQYYCVGVPEVREPIRYKLSIGAMVLGISLILASIPAFVFNPMIGGVLLAIGLSILAPAAFSFMNPNVLDPKDKQMEEKIIFQTGANLLKQPLIDNENRLDSELVLEM